MFVPAMGEFEITNDEKGVDAKFYIIKNGNSPGKDSCDVTYQIHTSKPLSNQFDKELLVDENNGWITWEK